GSEAYPAPEPGKACHGANIVRQAPKSLIAVLCAATLAGCGSWSDALLGGNRPTEGTPGFVRGFLGGVVADEPRAAFAGRDILAAGGSAVDAAVAVGFTLGVTLPSRASLGGGGVCLAFDPRRNETISVQFLPGLPAVAPGADRPAALPGTPRGLFALHARLGRLPFEQVIAPAEQAARFGTPASRAFVTDLAAVWQPLSADPQAREIFGAAGGTRPVAEGDTVTQLELANLIGTIRRQGVGELYQGNLARRLADASAAAGGAFTVEELRATLPRAALAATAPLGADQVHVSAVGGSVGAAVMLQRLRARASPGEAEAAALAAAAAVRAGADPVSLLGGAAPAGGSVPPVLGATTGFTVLDRNGQAVACALTMNNLFGTGRIAPTLGLVLAAAPGVGAVPPALPAVLMVTNPNVRAFRLAGTASGGEAAPVALGAAAARAMAGESAQAALAGPRSLRGAEDGVSRANLISCSRYLPGSNGSCTWATDPRGSGLALGAD
ncbi:MAG: gamma-glutamyltransferase family protein, partial [Acetobacteraceae bacterium]|nr:gamma-glutamyltransferase family protein [Acetobacteraceae bacterium]